MARKKSLRGFQKLLGEPQANCINKKLSVLSTIHVSPIVLRFILLVSMLYVTMSKEGLVPHLYLAYDPQLLPSV